jgi:transposase
VKSFRPATRLPSVIQPARPSQGSAGSGVKWLQRWYETGSAVAKPRGGSVSPLEKHAAVILGLIAEQLDLTLKEALAELLKRRIRTSQSALSRFFRRHSITLKKSLQAAERERPDVARARRRWIREQGMLDPAQLVFIDETAVSTNMTRLCGRAARGVRVIGRVPLGEWKTITFVAGLRHNGMTAPMVVEGPMTGEMFRAYVEQCLAKTLRRNDIVVMDNLKAHKVAGIAEAIARMGASVRYLPKYSPRSQSDRAVLQQIQGLSAQSCRANGSRNPSGNSQVRAAARGSRMCKLLQACRLCFQMTGGRFSMAFRRIHGTTPKRHLLALR